MNIHNFFYLDSDGNIVGIFGERNQFISIHWDDFDGVIGGALGGLVTVIRQAHGSGKILSVLDLQMAHRVIVLLVEQASLGITNKNLFSNSLFLQKGFAS